MSATQPQRENDERLVIPYVEEFLKRYELQKIHVDFVHRVVLLVIAGLGLITALSWDDLFKDFFNVYFGRLPSVEQKLIYALFLTLITAAVTIILTRFIGRGGKKDKS